MIGAALAAYLGGAVHDALGDYTSIFLAASLLGFVAAGLALRISVPGRPDRTPTPTPESVASPEPLDPGGTTRAGAGAARR